MEEQRIKKYMYNASGGYTSINKKLLKKEKLVRGLALFLWLVKVDLCDKVLFVQEPN